MSGPKLKVILTISGMESFLGCSGSSSDLLHPENIIATIIMAIIEICASLSAAGFALENTFIMFIV